MSDQEINIACAERIGWKRHPDCHDIFIVPGKTINSPGSSTPRLPNFHGSMDAAMQLVKLAAKDQWFSVITNGDGQWVIVMHSDRTGGEVYCSHESLPAAICEAFLKLPAGEGAQ